MQWTKRCSFSVFKLFSYINEKHPAIGLLLVRSQIQIWCLRNHNYHRSISIFLMHRSIFDISNKAIAKTRSPFRRYPNICAIYENLLWNRKEIGYDYQYINLQQIATEFSLYERANVETQLKAWKIVAWFYDIRRVTQSALLEQSKTYITFIINGRKYRWR